MKWVESEAQDDFIMWLFGPAGAGKSAIAKRIAELAVERGLLIGTFFFSRTSSTRNIKDRPIATLAYQMAVSIPDTRTLIEDASNEIRHLPQESPNSNRDSPHQTLPVHVNASISKADYYRRARRMYNSQAQYPSSTPSPARSLNTNYQ